MQLNDEKVTQIAYVSGGIARMINSKRMNILSEKEARISNHVTIQYNLENHSKIQARKVLSTLGV